MTARQSRQKGLNKLELAGRTILENMNISFSEQVIMYNKFCVDVLLDNYLVIIQWDGDYWHGNSSKFPNPDKRQIRRIKLDQSQDTYLSKCGYTILRFWESDVHNKPEYVTDTIMRTLAKEQNEKELKYCEVGEARIGLELSQPYLL